MIVEGGNSCIIILRIRLAGYLIIELMNWQLSSNTAATKGHKCEKLMFTRLQDVCSDRSIFLVSRFTHVIQWWRGNHSGESGPGLTTICSKQWVRVIINACIIAD